VTDILFAEDDAEIREWVTFALSHDGHRVRAVADGVAALTAYAERRPDLMILDVMMPKASGYDVLLKVRERDRTLPVLMLTAKSTESDKVMGLGVGADDYMTKPFGVRELKARVSALLRRASVMDAFGKANGTFLFASQHVDEAKRTLVTPHGGAIELTEHEVGILRFFAAHPNEIASREALLAAVWGAAYDGTNRTLDNRILALRKKLGDDARRIETVYGSGYRYRPSTSLNSLKNSSTARLAR